MRRLWQRYRLSVYRRHLLWRAFRARHKLSPLLVRRDAIKKSKLLCFSCVRNEFDRLPHFLDYYRSKGVEHFLIVDNGSDDGTTDYLKRQDDVSVWHTSAGYKASRFGLDWTNWLQLKFGRSKWCLTVDADELLVYPYADSRSIGDLCDHLDKCDVQGFGALMIDLYPQGPLAEGTFRHGDDPLSTLRFFDAGPYRSVRQLPKKNLWVQGGVRERVFFENRPESGPTLNKIPLVKWHWRYVYINSTHALLPSKLNTLYDGPGDRRCCGALLHTKFLPNVGEKSEEEKARKQHFGEPEKFEDYYDAVIASPSLFSPQSLEYRDWRQLEQLRLLNRGSWQN